MSNLYIKCPKTGNEYPLDEINELYRTMDLWGTVIYFECNCGSKHDSYLSKKL
ncbi:hypothetical protein [Methanobacterium oryzae]|uniref:hypothetical protein n=1 Tax=Methanobacterium oryzae TaxID=69540 RepID=UPI003D1971AA